MEKDKQMVVVVDELDNQVEVAPRQAAEQDQSKIIRMIYILLFNDDGQILLQRRHGDLERYPNYWEVSASGSVLPEEPYPDAAQRKLKDELGLSVPLFHEHKSVINIPEKADRLTAIFVGKVDDLTAVKPNEQKVKEVRWVHTEEGKQGYLLTPSCEYVLNWWEKHGEEIIKNVEEKLKA